MDSMSLMSRRLALRPVLEAVGGGAVGIPLAADALFVAGLAANVGDIVGPPAPLVFPPATPVGPAPVPAPAPAPPPDVAAVLADVAVAFAAAAAVAVAVAILLFLLLK